MKTVNNDHGWVTTMTGAQDEAHEGHLFQLHYNVSNLGAMETPDDAIQITWKTPNIRIMHLTIHVQCGAAALYKFTEGWSTAGVSPSGTIVGFNKNRSFPNSEITFSYDATLVTDGDVLEQEYITTGKFDAGESRSAQEWMLKPGTNYAISLYLAAAQIATISMGWYLHE
jgi:hypothetical protein